MTASIGLVILDCDGVLVDSERIGVRVDAAVLAQLGWHLTEAEIVDRFLGRSTESITKEVEDHLGRPLPESWAAEVAPLYRRALAAELRPVDGIAEALDELPYPLCGIRRESREDALHPRAHRPVQALRGPRLQCYRGGPWQARA